MLTFIKEILTWWDRQTFGTRMHTIFLENLLEKMNLETNIMKIKKKKKMGYL